MKTQFKILITACLCVSFFAIMAFSGCDGNTFKAAKFASLTYGGCNGILEETSQRGTENNGNDTVILNWQNDTLKVLVGINYICCSTFEATQTADNNEISLLITETTLSPDQYCRCECYYTFEYCFTDISQKSYEVNVMFDSQDDSKDKNFTEQFNL